MNEAKAIVSRDVAVDLPAGPSEVVVLASDGADLELADLELAAQREHGPDAVCRLVEANGDLDARARPRRGARARAPRAAGRGRGAARAARSQRRRRLRRALVAGRGRRLRDRREPRPPDRRPGRAVGGLGLEAFLKPVTVQRLTADGLARVRPVVEALAELEGMPAHAEAVRR